VGAVLALELARHGVPSMVVERSAAAGAHPKPDDLNGLYLNGRSMELLRRLGLAQAVRARGNSAEHASDVLWTHGFDRPPVLVWHHPSVNQIRRRYATVNDGSAPVEPYQRIPGPVLDELTRDALRRHPLVDFREGWTCADLRLEPGGVVATVVEGKTGLRHTVEAAFLAACDGAGSTVRQCLEIPLDEAIPRTQYCTVYFRSEDPALRRFGQAFLTIDARWLTLVPRPEPDTWAASLPVPPDDPLAANPVGLLRERLRGEFTVDEVSGVAQWEGALAVASAYRRGAAFLVGDAAHQFYPVAGHGISTGIADAVDLGWKLAATVAGWGGPDLLASYEAERRPVALFNREVSAGLLAVRSRFARLATAGVSRECLAGVLAPEAYQVDGLGVQFGQRYAGSPVIWPEAGDAPAWDWRRIVPTTWPGSRAPAVRLAGGAELFDRFGVGFTLVDLSGRGTGAELARAALERGVPVTHLPVPDPAVRACWERELVLVRPDQYVAWRDDLAPVDWAAVLDRVTGNGTTRTRDVPPRLAAQTHA
jgi:2-polyprenyl-6-methoxyphenol hydroxylase-like FAD-dependent oxidoreductase